VAAEGFVWIRGRAVAASLLTLKCLIRVVKLCRKANGPSLLCRIVRLAGLCFNTVFA
jgi:hypothetical protein